MTTKSKRVAETEKSTGTKRVKTPCEEFKVSEPADVQKVLNSLKHSDPVLQLHLTNDDSPDITPSSENLLESLIFPLSTLAFKTSCFRKKAVYVCSNRRDRASDISLNYMFGLDSKQIFEETSSDNVFLWIPSNDKGHSSNTSNHQSLQSIAIHDPDTANILHTHSKYASYCRAPPELEQQLVSNMLRSVGLGLGQYDPTGEKITTLGRGEVETFIGTKGHLTGWHTDFQENFTIQLSGRKKWTLKQGTVKHPIRGTTPHYRSSDDVIENQIKAARLSNPDYQFDNQDLDANAFGTEVDIIMDEGDVLYFPAGMWHKVETLEEGVSINISLMGTTYASLVCGTLEHLLLEKDEWREVICSDRKSGNDVVEKLRALINSLPSEIEQLQKRGLSEGILPPVLRTPPGFELVGNEEEIKVCEGEDEDLGDYNSSDDMEKEGTCSKSSEGDEQSTIGGGDQIIDIHEFQMPETFKQMTEPRNKLWKRNPLASLMRMTEIKSYFASNDVGSGEDYKHLFVLNVNFAGNEVHESAVRVVLRDSSGCLERLCSTQGEDLDEAIENLETPPTALLYYGYII